MRRALGDGRHPEQGEDHTFMTHQSRSYPITDQPRDFAAVWIYSALCAAVGLAGVALAVLGPGERGTVVALQLTARLSFLLFWSAYAGSAMTALFGPAFAPLKRHGRQFGLAFASAHLVHIALVVWLTHIGSAPPIGSFIFFGIAALWVYLLALFSIAGLQQRIGSKSWWLLRVVGLNYIAYAFAVDFLRAPQFGSIKYLLGYLPFAALSVVGPMLCFAAFVRRAMPTVLTGARLARSKISTAIGP